MSKLRLLKARISFQQKGNGKVYRTFVIGNP